MKQPRDISPFRAWLLATRPRTLPAAVAPVIVGTAMAIADKSFQCLPALATLTGALLLQIGVNLANDYDSPFSLLLVGPLGTLWADESYTILQY